MSKKPQSRKFRIGTQTLTDEEAVQVTVNRAVEAYNYSARKLTPLIKAQQMGAGEAATLIAIYTDAVMRGKENDETHSITVPETEDATYLLLALWGKGQFQPPHDYPYTFAETFALFKDEIMGEA